ncbi:MAG: Ig-like domain-containing protein, partial [Caldilineaceae bacterium]
PFALDDLVRGVEDRPLRVLPLANDSDPDGDSLRLLAVTQPTRGSASIEYNALIYQPAANFSGGDSFVYTVGDGQGHTAEAVVWITISALNDPPVSQDDSAQTQEDTPVILSVLANDSDVDGDGLAVLAVEQPGRGQARALGDGTILYTPADNFHGSDNFRYTAGDGNGGAAVGQVQVLVQPVNDPPVAVDDAAVTAADTSMTIELLANDWDVDGDDLTASLLEPPATGSASIAEGRAIYHPAPGFVGEVRFRYRLEDAAGESDTASVSIFVVAAGGAATLTASDDSFRTAEDRPALLPVLGNDSSSQSQPIALLSVAQPANGSAVIVRDAAGERIRYTPAPDFHGSDTFPYTAGDGSSSASAIVTITVLPINDPPTARDDDAITPEEQPVIVDSLANDSDPDGDALALVSFGQPGNGRVTVLADGRLRYRPHSGFRGEDSFVYAVEDGQGGLATAQVRVTVQPIVLPPSAVDDETALDEDNSITFDPLGNDREGDGRRRSGHLRLVVVGAAGNGAAVANDDDSITYTPRPNFYGEDSFSYTIEDSSGSQASARVRVLVRAVADAPQPVEDAAVTEEDTPVALMPQANDVDNDGVGVQIVSFSQPAHGSVVQNADGSFTYTPAPGFRGVDSFVYTLSGQTRMAAAGSGRVTVLVAPELGLVTATDDSAVTTEEQPVTLTPLANDKGEGLQVLGVDGASHGVVILHSDGSITYTPHSDFQGSDSFGYTVGDNGKGGDRATVTITVQPVNDPPKAEDDSIALTEDTSLNFAPLHNDTDPDGDSLTVLSVGHPRFGDAVAHADGSVTYTPGGDFFGTDRFAYRVGDGSLESVGFVFVTVTPANDSPEAALDMLTTAEDTPILFDPLANDFDADGDPLGLVGIGRPLFGAAAIQPDGYVSYTPVADFFGSDELIYRVSDSSQTVTGTIRIRVAAVNDPPQAQPDVAVAASAPVTIDVLHNDTDDDGDMLFLSQVGPAAGSVAWADDRIVYQAAPGFSGTDVFTYSVSDGRASATSTVSVRVATAAAALVVTAEPAAGAGVLPGEEVRYALQVTNVGGLPLTGVVVESSLPTSTTVTAMETEIGPAASRTGDTRELRWRLAELPVGQTLHVRFTLRTDEDLRAPVVLTATVQSEQTPLQRIQPLVHTIDPTAVKLAYFLGERTPKGVRVRWHTVAELETWGFHLWRGTSADPEQAIRVTEVLIPAQGGDYIYEDTDAPANDALWYWLEEIEADGGSVRYGPAILAKPQLQAAHKLLLPVVIK